MSIRLKFNLAMLLVFILGFFISAYFVDKILLENAKEEVSIKARIMMQAAISARSYTVEELEPLLKQIKTSEFISQTVPSYAATSSMRRLRKAYPEYYYKEAVLNPTNLEHKAAAWEEDIIHYFRNNDAVTEYSGVRATPTGQYLFLSSPFKITNTECLVCHSSPEAAPASMVKKYGPHNGFGWKHNEIVGAQIVNVPMAIPIARASDTFKAFMVILAGIFLTIWAVLNLLLHLIIIKRINNIVEKSEEISKGNMTVDEFEQNSKDELSSLGHSFNLMYRSLNSAVKLFDRAQV